jgi:hypothetical protein
MSIMDIINDSDTKFKDEYPKIIKEVTKKKLEEYEPTKKEMEKVYEIILNYIKEKNRKMYGGYTLNMLLKDKDEKLAIYEEDDMPDIDFYSTEPLIDLKTLCDKLENEGFKGVMGQEAQHPESYKIFVNQHEYCDITYMPSNIYHKVKFIKIKDYLLIHPWFMMIDYFRMFTDPIGSYFRLDKTYVRYMKLQKAYPLPLIKKPLMIDNYNNKTCDKIIELLEEFMTSRNDILVTGFYIYNYYLNKSNYIKENDNYNYIRPPYLEYYSINFINDGLSIIDFINNLPDELNKNIIHKEAVPFFQFLGHCLIIYFKDGKNEIPILYLYNNYKKCIPYKEVNYIKFGKTIEEKKNKINIVGFDQNILHALIMLVKFRVDDENDLWNDILYRYINGIVLFKKNYFTKNNKDEFDNTIFQSFITNCKGYMIAPEREKRIRMEERKKQGKALVFRYEPSNTNKFDPSKVFFSNTSGNVIRKDKLLKVIEKNKDKNIDYDKLFNDDKDNKDNTDEKNKKNNKDYQKDKSLIVEESFYDEL